MKKRRLGRTSLVVSEICLGTMTFGSTTEPEESHQILNKAFDAGIDFLDTAEIYPVPPQANWVHRSEEIVGDWLKNQQRESVIVATKVCGPGHGWFVPPVRHGKTGVDRFHIRKAIEGSLKRLQTDYIDLYQVHWPDHDFGYEETLETLEELIQAGLVRAVGCSNETPWGLMKSLAVAEKYGFQPYQTIQNNFSLIHRRFEDALADICRREQVSLLPYSPIGGGVLSGKYNQPNPPEDSRFMQYLNGDGERQQIMARRFVNEKSLATTEKLQVIAAELGMSSTTLAVAWSKQHDYVGSTIIGARKLDQLQESLDAAEVVLDSQTLQRIDEITQEFLYPLG